MAQQPQQQVLMQQVYAPTVQPIHRPAQRIGFAHNSARNCGAVQVSCGLLIVITNIIMIASSAFGYFFGFGFWGAIFFLISGGLGIQAGRSKHTCPIVGTLIMSIFSCLVAFIIIIFAAVGLSVESNAKFCRKNWEDVHRYRYHQCYAFPNKPSNDNLLNVRTTMHVINLLVGIVMFIVPIIQSALSCNAVCCRRRQDPPNAIMYTAHPGGQIPAVAGVQYQMQPTAQCAPKQATSGQPYPTQKYVGPPPNQYVGPPPNQYVGPPPPNQYVGPPPPNQYVGPPPPNQYVGPPPNQYVGPPTGFGGYGGPEMSSHGPPVGNYPMQPQPGMHHSFVQASAPSDDVTPPFNPLHAPPAYSTMDSMHGIPPKPQ